MSDYDLWVDFQRRGPDRLTTTLARYASPGVDLRPGVHVVVGAEDSEVAVARIVEVSSDGFVTLDILPGPASEHWEKVQHRVRTG
jgi:hypothetical protein